MHINENSLCSNFDLVLIWCVHVIIMLRNNFTHLKREPSKKSVNVNLLLNSEMFKYLIHWTGDVAIEFRTLHRLELADFFMISSTLKIKHTEIWNWKKSERESYSFLLMIFWKVRYITFCRNTVYRIKHILHLTYFNELCSFNVSVFIAFTYSNADSVYDLRNTRHSCQTMFITDNQFHSENVFIES